MKQKLFKRASVVFLALMVMLSSMSLPTLHVVMAEESMEGYAGEYVEETVAEAETEEAEPATETLTQEVAEAVTEASTEIAQPEETQALEEVAETVAETAAETSAEQAETPAVEEEQKTSEAAEKAEPKEETKQEETKETMPAQKFSGVAGGVSVRVIADEGTFPAGTTMKVVPVSAAAIYDTVNAAVEGEVTAIKAVDITFYNAEGKEIQPAIPVHLTMNASGMDKTADKEIVHIDNTGANVIEDANVAGNKANLEADHFSIYAVVETGDNARLQVNFINGADEIASPIVKKTDMADETLFNKIIYDPGAGELPEGTVFRGWTTNKDYTVADIDNGMNIDAVRAAVKEKLNAGVTESEGLPEQMNFYAMTFHVFNVTFKDEDNVVIKNEALLTKGESIDYTVNQPYTPKTSDQEFQGWYVGTENAIAKDGTYYAEGDTIPNETAVTVSKDVVLSAKAPLGAWLIFKENGSGASYTSPQFLENEAPTEPADPVRNGYIFGGWYTDEACTDGNEFNFTAILETTTRIYAKWTPITNAAYTVIIWKQNVAGNGYDFETSVSLTGTVGQTVNTVSQQGTGNNAYARINGTNYQYTGFHLNNYTQNVVINPEGTAVVNVYYNRTSYTLTFRRSATNATVYKTITALYGQPIGENFPITENGASAEWRWDPQNSSTFNQVLVYIDIMPAENVTFYRSTSNAGAKYMEFYVEALPGQTPDRTWNGRSFVKYGNTITAKYNFFTEAEDFLELTGYEKFGSDPAFINGSANVNTGGTIRFYYTRKEFSINYMDGIYVDGNGNAIDEQNRGQLKKEDGIVYGADLSTYNKDGADYYKPTYTGYAFEGWYVDDACTQPYTFATMTDGGITVYAKWRQIQYRVFLHPNADDYQGYQIGDQSTSFRLDYGDGLNAIDARSDDYELVGWYTDEACTHSINFDAFVANDTHISTAYDKTESTERDQYGNPTENTNKDATNNRFWITKKLDLYAKWRSKLLGANGITVLYDAGDGSFSGGGKEYTDPLTYKDRSKAVATTATTPSDTTKFEFEYWDIQKWDKDKEAFVSSGTTVLPGDGFEVLKADAEVIENEGSTAADPKYTYIVKLVAVYKAIEDETLTHIDWYANNTTTAVKSDDGLKMNTPIAIEPASLFTYEGYEFIGWARYATGSKPSSPTDDSQLWLVYDKDAKTFKENGKVVTQVACDEKQPYHDLYAVWAPIQYTVIFDKNAEDAAGEMANEVFKYDEEKALTTNAFTRTNYEFLGWSTDATATTATYTDAQTVKNLATEADAEITLYAVWKQNVADVTVEHYLLGTDTAFKTDTIKDQKVGETYTAVPETTYQEKNLTVNSYDPTQAITVKADGNIIKIYYTLQLTITGKTDSKTYDGTPLAGEYTITGALAADEASIKEAVGEAPSITEVSESPKEYQAAVDGIPGYYVITNNKGTLTITKATVPEIVVTDDKDGSVVGESKEKVYDGQPLSATAKATLTTTAADGTTTTIDIPVLYSTDEGKTWKAEAPSITDVGEIKVQVKTNSENFEEKTTSYTLKVTPKEITVTDTATETYDGTEKTLALTADKAKGLVEGEILTLEGAEIKGTEVGEYTEVAKYTWSVAKADDSDSTGNYTIRVEGKLTIKKGSQPEIVVTDDETGDVVAKDLEKVYDGKPLSATAKATLTTTAADGTTTTTEIPVLYSTDEGKTWKAEAPSITDVGEITVQVKTNSENVEEQTTSYTLKVTPKEITVNGTATETYDGTEKTLALTADKAEGVVEGEVLTLEGAEIKGTEVGTYTEVAEYTWSVAKADDSDSTKNYTIKVTGTLTITKGSQPEIVVTDDADGSVVGESKEKVYDGKELSATAKATLTTTAADGTTTTTEIPVLYSTDEGKTWTKEAPAITDVGEIKVQVKTDSANVEEQTTSYTLKVTPKEITVNDTATETYDGTEKTLALTADKAEGVVEGEVLTLDGAEIKGTEAGTYTDVAEYTWSVAKADGSDSTKNYTIKVTGTLTINKAGQPEIVVTDDKDGSVVAGSKEKVYDGQPLSATATATLTIKDADGNEKTLDVPVLYSTDNGTTWSEKAPSITDVGEVAVQVKTNSENFEEMTTSYTLKVTPKEITVSDTATETYDGTEKTLALTADKAEGVVEGEVLTLEGAEIKGTEVGEYTDVADYTWSVAKADESDSTKNYTIKVEGKLTIKKAGQPEIVVTDDESGDVVAKDLEKVYDGKPLSATAKATLTIKDADGNEKKLDVPVLYSTDNGATWSEKAPSITDVDEVAVQVKTNSENFEEMTTSYTLKVTPKEITVSDTATETYDGTEKTLTIAASKAEGVVEGETLTLEGAEIKGTDAGEYTDVAKYTWSVAKADGSDSTGNYTIKVEGKLTIQKAGKPEIVVNDDATGDVVAESLEKVYDGKELSATATATLTIKDTEGNEKKLDVPVLYSTDGTTWSEEAPSITDVSEVKVQVKTNSENFEEMTTSYTLKVTPKEITVSDTATETYDGSEKTLTIAASKAEGVVEGETLTLEGAEIKGTNAGEYTDVAEYTWSVAKADDSDSTGNYTIKVEGTLTINKATIIDPENPKDPEDPDAKRYEVTDPEDTVYNGLEQKQPITVKDTKTGKDLVEGTDVEITYTAATDVGEVTITVKGIGNYTGEITRTYKITPAKYSVKTGSDSKVYDGTALTKDEAEITGLVNGETATIKATGSQTNVGTSDNTYKLTWDGTAKENNYVLDKEDLGTLEVTKAKLPEDPDDPDDPANKRFTVSQPEDVVYNGKEQKQPVTVTDKETGKELTADDITITYSEDVTNVGTVTVTITANEDGNYDGTFTRTYKITPAKYSVKTGSDSKVYDGTALTKDEAEITGLVNGETATIKATGSQTNVGTSDNTYELTWDGTAKENNYVLDKEELGTLEVTKAKIIDPEDPKDPEDPDAKRYEVTDPEDTVYNGLEQKQPITVKDTKTGKDLVEGTDVEITYTAATDVGEVTITVKGIGNYTGEITRTYKITPAKYSVKTGSDSKVYDGTALTKDDAEITGLVNGETATIKATGSQTNVGTSDNTYELTWDGTAKESNYVLDTEEIGTLEVTKAKLPEDPDDPKDPGNERFTVSQPTNVVYNGKVQKQPVTIKDSKTGKNLVEGKDFRITYSPAKNAGKVTVTIIGLGNYEGTFTRTYRITRARVTIETPSAQKVFDGTALRSRQGTITGLVNGETAEVRANGSQTAVGTSKNTVGRIIWGTADENNYKIVKTTLGNLTITAAPAPIPVPVPPVPPAPQPIPQPDPPAPAPQPQPPIPQPEPTPEPPTEEITEPDTPIAPVEGSWALLNLILSIVTCILAIVMIITFAVGKEDEDENENGQPKAKAEGEEDEKKRKRNGLKFLGLIPAIGTVVLFLLTENMKLKMVITDKWTILTAIITVIAIVLTIVIKNRPNKKDEEDAANKEA